MGGHKPTHAFPPAPLAFLKCCLTQHAIPSMENDTLVLLGTCGTFPHLIWPSLAPPTPLATQKGVGAPLHTHPRPKAHNG